MTIGRPMTPRPFAEAVFFGSSAAVAQLVFEVARLDLVICEPRHFNADLYDLCAVTGATFAECDSAGALDALLVKKYDLGVSFGTGIIFKSRHMERFRHGIWNIHSGPLPEVRGRHPISWGFIEGLPFGVTVHQVEEEIDKGLMLAKRYVYRDLADTQYEIEAKIEAEFLGGLLREAVDNYLAGRTQELAEGTYYPSLAGKLDSVDPAENSAARMFNIFKSQFRFGGVSVAGKLYTRCSVYCPGHPEIYEGCDVYDCADGRKVALS